MKTLILCGLFLLSFPALAESNRFLCSLKHAKTIIPIAEKHSSYDKNRHCTVSCMLAIRCNDNEVLLVGILKEVKDFFGPGEADKEDIVADRYGVDLVRYKRAKTDKECLDQCDLRY